MWPSWTRRGPGVSLEAEPRDCDREMYKWRNQIEKFFARIKEFRAVATRCDKTDGCFAAAIHLVASVVSAK